MMYRKIKPLNLLLILSCFSISMLTYGQDAKQLNELKPDGEFDNIKVQKIAGDSLSTSFVIWVKKEVPKHKHVTHSESIYVLEGKGIINIAGKDYPVQNGAYFFVPKNTAHSLHVEPGSIVKVLSVQSPEFSGSDRVPVE